MGDESKGGPKMATFGIKWVHKWAISRVSYNHMGVSLNGGNPPKHLKMIIFSRKNPMLVGVLPTILGFTPLLLPGVKKPHVTLCMNFRPFVLGGSSQLVSS